MTLRHLREGIMVGMGIGGIGDLDGIECAKNWGATVDFDELVTGR